MSKKYRIEIKNGIKYLFRKNENIFKILQVNTKTRIESDALIFVEIEIFFTVSINMEPQYF